MIPKYTFGQTVYTVSGKDVYGRAIEAIKLDSDSFKYSLVGQAGSNLYNILNNGILPIVWRDESEIYATPEEAKSAAIVMSKEELLKKMKNFLDEYFDDGDEEDE